MKKYIRNKKIVIELGSESGSSKKFLGKKIISTDIIKHKNIDLKLDMNKINLLKKFKNKVDVFILNHSLHHSNNPIKVIHNLQKNLKANGLILINEPEISLVFKIFLKVFNIENWNLNFKQINTKNFWLQNNATGRILFGQKKVGSLYNKKLLIKKNLLNEFLIFLNSSGNSIEAPHIKLNNPSLSIINKFDDIITFLLPSIFALNRSVILKKINE